VVSADPALQALLTRLGARRDAPLAPRTTWRVGGPARFLVQSPPTEALAELLGRCADTGSLICVLGRGSNVLVADAGIDGVVVTFPDARAPLSLSPEGRIVAGAGVSMARLSAEANGAGLAGLSWCAGIPGSVGGSAVMNAGLVTGGTREMRDVVTGVTYVDPSGAVHRLSAGALEYATRRSALQGAGGCVTEVEFQATGRDTPEALAAATRAMIAERRQRQPRLPTAGSTFVGPEGQPPAGYWLDRAGLKGHQRGGARVSPIHANWIENTGGATAADIADLMQEMMDVVQQKFGVALRPEVRRLP
jgi:UDP-N-acetylmuramate dehydrogenase